MPNCNIPNCEVIRRLCMEPYKDEEPKMHTLMVAMVNMELHHQQNYGL